MVSSNDSISKEATTAPFDVEGREVEEVEEVVHVTPRNAQGTVSGTLVVVSLVVVSLVVVSFGAQHGLGGGVGSARGGGDGQRRFTPRTGHERRRMLSSGKKKNVVRKKGIMLSGKRTMLPGKNNVVEKC